jgi:glycosyltransferase involved in cell wall biosynthesis
VTEPKAIFGVPLYNHTVHLPEALESLLSQSYRQFHIMLVDDSTIDNPAEIVGRYARCDKRISYIRNPRRLGMAGNWRQTFIAARERFPGAPYFAWGSDHDIWHPHWLEAMLEAIESDATVVAAYPLVMDVLEGRGELRMRTHTPQDTVGVADRAERLRRASLSTAAGYAIYALFRVSALERAGVFRPVLLPDRLLFAEMSLYGQFKQVPEYLWMRRRLGQFSLARQRSNLFAGRTPPYAFAPWPFIHALILARELLLPRAATSEVNRRESLSLVSQYFAFCVYRQAMRSKRVARGWASRRRSDMSRLFGHARV